MHISYEIFDSALSGLSRRADYAWSLEWIHS